MVVRTQAEPPQARAIVASALSRRLVRGPHLLSLQGDPHTGSPIAHYVLEGSALELQHPLQAAKFVGWQYPVVGGQALGLAQLAAHGEDLSYAGLLHGVLAERVLQAAALAEQTFGARPENFEVRLLDIPSRRLFLLWLVGPEGHFISVMAGSPPGTAPLTVIDDIGPLLTNAQQGPTAPPAAGAPSN